jgi:hypothetical protein
MWLMADLGRRWQRILNKMIGYKETFAIIAAGLAIYANWGYLRDVLKGKIKPHPYTWAIWSIVSAAVFFGQLQKGAGIGVVPTFFAEIFTVLIFLSSFKHGFKNIRKVDHFFLVLAVIGLLPWYFTKDPTISIVIVTIIDLVAFLPTIAKSWTKPQTENHNFFEVNIIRHILSLASLQSYNLATVFHSSVMIFANASTPIEYHFRKNIKKLLK